LDHPENGVLVTTFEALLPTLKLLRIFAVEQKHVPSFGMSFHGVPKILHGCPVGSDQIELAFLSARCVRYLG
jgi:hypothetical protein